MLAAVIGDVADAQTDGVLGAGFADLAAALTVESGSTAERVPSNVACGVAAAMLDTRGWVEVDPRVADPIVWVLRPLAASHRTRTGGKGMADWVLATVCETAAQRLQAASVAGRVPRSADVVRHEIETHIEECPADAAVWVSHRVRCPCAAITAHRCPKCGSLLETFVSRPPCSHVEQLCRGSVDGWTELDDVDG